MNTKVSSNIPTRVSDESVINAIHFIGQLSTFVRRSNLEKLKELQTRFNSVECSAVIDKSYSDVQEAMRKINLGYVDLSKGVNNAVADHLLSFVKTVCIATGVALPSSEQINFTVKFSESLLQKSSMYFASEKNKQVREALKLIGEHTGVETDGLQILCYKIDMFINTMNTLTEETEFEQLESFIQERMKVPGWFTNGEPDELLVHSINTLRHPCANLAAIYANPVMCKTHAVLKGEKPADEFSLLVQSAR